MTYHTLYHGTSAKRVERILKEGLLPRSEERKGNWKGELESKAGLVYLSSWMPMFYAGQAGDVLDEDFAFLKVRVKEKDMYPDEDFVLHALAQNHGLSFRETLRSMTSIKPQKYKKFAPDSLRSLGTVAVRQVKPKDILDHRIIKYDIELWSWMGGDTSVSPVAHLINGAKYKHRLELLFTKGLDAVREDIEKERAEWNPPQEVLDTITKEKI